MILAGIFGILAEHREVHNHRLARIMPLGQEVQTIAKQVGMNDVML